MWIPYWHRCKSKPDVNRELKLTPLSGYYIVMIRSWLARLIIPTLHIHSGLANRKAWTTQLIMAQIKTTIKSFTKTCITSSQHASVNQPSNKCQGCIPLTSIQSSCHHKPFPEGRDTAKLWVRSEQRTPWARGWDQFYVSRTTLKKTTSFRLCEWVDSSRAERRRTRPILTDLRESS